MLQNYNNTQKYFLLTDSVLSIFWLFVTIRLFILYPLTGSKFLPGGIADFYISILIITVSIEIFNYLTVFRHVPGIQNVNNALQKPHKNILIIVSISRLILAFVLYNYPKVARSEYFALLILAQSIKEFFRWFYNLQKVRLYNNCPWLLKFLRSITYLIFTPIETVSSIYIIFQSLLYSSHQIEFVDYDKMIKTVLKLILLAYLPVFYIVYKRTIIKYFFYPVVFSKPEKKLD